MPVADMTVQISVKHSPELEQLMSLLNEVKEKLDAIKIEVVIEPSPET